MAVVFAIMSGARDATYAGHTEILLGTPSGLGIPAARFRLENPSRFYLDSNMTPYRRAQLEAQGFVNRTKLAPGEDPPCAPVPRDSIPVAVGYQQYKQPRLPARFRHPNPIIEAMKANGAANLGPQNPDFGAPFGNFSRITPVELKPDRDSRNLANQVRRQGIVDKAKEILKRRRAPAGAHICEYPKCNLLAALVNDPAGGTKRLRYCEAHVAGIMP